MKIALVITLMAGVSPAWSSDSLEDLIPQTAAIGHAVNREAALEFVRRIESCASVIGQEPTGKLCAIVKDPDVHGAVRLALLDLICSKVDRASADQIVTLMRELTDDYRRAKKEGKVTHAAGDRFHLIPHLIRAFLKSASVELATRLEDQTLLLEYYLDILLDRDFHYEDIRWEAAKRIADNPADIRVRQDYAYRFIESSARYVPSAVFDGLMDDQFAERLRPLLFTGEAGVRSFNFLARGLLVEYGDVETARQLRQWAASQDDPEEAARRVAGPLWKIDAQQNPQMLLDYIRSGEWGSSQGDSYTRRVWAMDKALKLGIPPDNVRDAILEHAPKVLGHPGLESALRTLKKEAVERGVLRPDDLPEVASPPKTIQEAMELRKRGEKTRSGEGSKP